MTFQYEAVQVGYLWQVERIRHDLEGQIEITIFLGHDAESRARQYAAMMNRAQLQPASRHAQESPNGD